MVAESYIFGHPVIWDEKLNDWVWEDTKEPYSKRPKRCPQCSKLPTKEGYDPCIGEIPDAISVCCGHGIEDGYIVWDIDKNWYDDDKPKSAFRKFLESLLS